MAITNISCLFGNKKAEKEIRKGVISLLQAHKEDGNEEAMGFSDVIASFKGYGVEIKYSK
jgi:hypothetical protein